MQRRDFLKSTVAAAVAAELGLGKAQARVPAHNWGNFDYGSGPQVTDRLNQGPFPQYPPEAVIPTDDVVMTTTPSEDAVPSYGKGLVTYVTADSGTGEIKSDNIPQAIEDLARFPLGQQLYIRPTWREVQPRPGRLDLPGYVKLVFEMAKKNNKRVGLRIQMSAPDYTHEPALPDFVLEKVPKVELVLSDQESGASAKRFWRIRTRVISRGLTILFFSRHSKNWSDYWQRNSMATRLSSSSTPLCTASGVKGTPGHSATILSLTTRQRNGPG
jgi:hypothetical protein